MVYVAPKHVDGEVEIEDDDVTSELQFWENSLILYVLSEDISVNMVKYFMVRVWNFVQLPNMYYRDDKYFLLWFKSHEDRNAVMMKELYTYRSIHVIIKEWRPNFSLKQDMMRTLPIWVKLQ